MKLTRFSATRSIKYAATIVKNFQSTSNRRRIRKSMKNCHEMRYLEITGFRELIAVLPRLPFARGKILCKFFNICVRLVACGIFVAKRFRSNTGYATFRTFMHMKLHCTYSYRGKFSFVRGYATYRTFIHRSLSVQHYVTFRASHRYLIWFWGAILPSPRFPTYLQSTTMKPNSRIFTRIAPNGQ